MTKRSENCGEAAPEAGATSQSEIEITSAMALAGVAAFWEFDHEADNPVEIASEIYKRMTAVRLQLSLQGTAKAPDRLDHLFDSVGNGCKRGGINL
jgi:hypothetical protein